MTSYKPEVTTYGDPPGDWSSNAVRMATRIEAETYVRDLFCRWTAVRDYRVVESDDPVSARLVDGRLEFLS
jgi:hypothetical protein